MSLDGLPDTVGCLSEISATVYSINNGFNVRLRAKCQGHKAEGSIYFGKAKYGGVGTVRQYIVGVWEPTAAQGQPSPPKKQRVDGSIDTNNILGGMEAGRNKQGEGGSAEAGEACGALKVKGAARNAVGFNSKYANRASYRRRWKRRRQVEGKPRRARRKAQYQGQKAEGLLAAWVSTEAHAEGACVVLAEAYRNDIRLVWDRPARPSHDAPVVADKCELSLEQVQSLTRKSLAVLAYYRAVLAAGVRWCQTACCKVAAVSDGAQCHPKTVRRYIITISSTNLHMYYESCIY